MARLSRGKKSGSKRKTTVLQLIARDLLLTGLVLCIFATFHHVIPRIRSQMEGPPSPVATAAPRPSPPPTAMPLPPREEPEQTESPAPEPEPTLDPSDWSALFADHFTEDVTVTENSYTSPDISVTVTRHEMEYQQESRAWPVVYYVADIYLARIDCFRSAFPEWGTYGNAEDIVASSGAVLAINGDMVLGNREKLCIRNGDTYSADRPGGDYCVMYYDGTVETYGPEAFDEAALLAEEPWQVWQFGPALLDEDGLPKREFNTTSNLLSRNPRTAFGYYEPGHYCFVVVDGRQSGYSRGLPMDGLADLMSELGCARAFNLDGGASSQMLFMGETVNSPCGYRVLTDMLVIVEPQEPSPGPK